jgi:chemotaxis protein CheD
LPITLFWAQHPQIPTINHAPKSQKKHIPLQTVLQTETLQTITTEIHARAALEEVRVNMAEMKVESKPIELVTSVGSCVAVCMHDPVRMCGGLAHVMLPRSAIAPQEPLPAKFADTAVPFLAHAIRKLGGTEGRLNAKIAGGANMFPNMNALNIGLKNIDAVKAALASHRIRLAAEDVGGSSGRRITFNIRTGVATVRRFNGAVTKL